RRRRRCPPAPAPPPLAGCAGGPRPATASTPWGEPAAPQDPPARPPSGSRALGELVEVGLALLHVGVAALLRLLGLVEEQRGVAGQLLEPGQAVVGGVEGGLEHAQGHGRVVE